MGVLQNQFSWSKSRDEKFRECPRQYFYHHYGSWGGWEASADPKVRELYILKNLKSRHMWVGEIVHHTIEDALKTHRETGKFETDVFLEAITRRMRREFRASRDRLYRKDPQKHVGLSEHEYEQKIPDSKWFELHETAKRCFSNFANSIFPRMVKPIPVHQWKLIETMQTFGFEGTPIYVKIDFCFMDAEGLKIVDWKTGKSEDVDNEIQLDCYGLFSREFFKVAAERIQTVECNVNSGQTVIRKMIEAKMDFAKHYLRNSIAGMKRILKDAEKNSAEEGSFPFTENERTCQYCNFKKVCAKWVL